MMDTIRREQLKRFEAVIDYKYSDLELLDLAFTHSSYSNENKHRPGHNERLEFLGDSVVNLVATDILYAKYNDLSEGELTKIRSSMVCEPAFAKAALDFKIDKFLLLGKGEELSGGRRRESLLADAFEAFCGSLYLDSGFEVVKGLLTDMFDSIAEKRLKRNNFFSDYKTALQEKYYLTNKGKVKYRLDREEGPDHNKLFFVSVLGDAGVIGKGIGHNKKEAEHSAAKDALMGMGFIDD